MFGDGPIQVGPVSSNHASRRQFFMAMTVRSALIFFSALKSRASSPIVMPCRIGIAGR